MARRKRKNKSDAWLATHPNPKSSPKEIVGKHGHRPHGPSILWPALYEHLKAKGMTKKKAAMISNGLWRKKRGLPPKSVPGTKGKARVGGATGPESGYQYRSILPMDQPTPDEGVVSAVDALDPTLDEITCPDCRNAILAARAATYIGTGITAAAGDKAKGKLTGAERLRQYWLHGEGAAKIRWNTPGDWTRCRRQLTKHLGPRAAGYCQLLHGRATGTWAGKNQSKTPNPAVKARAIAKQMAPSSRLAATQSTNEEAVMAEMSSGGKPLNVAAREKAAEKGFALPDGKLPIRNVDELKAAIRLRGKVEGHSATEIRNHIVKRARALDAVAELPEAWRAKQGAMGMYRCKNTGKIAAAACPGCPNPAGCMI
jgi:hypothetical protein